MKSHDTQPTLYHICIVLDGWFVSAWLRDLIVYTAKTDRLKTTIIALSHRSNVAQTNCENNHTKTTSLNDKILAALQERWAQKLEPFKTQDLLKDSTLMPEATHARNVSCIDALHGAEDVLIEALQPSLIMSFSEAKLTESTSFYPKFGVWSIQLGSGHQLASNIKNFPWGPYWRSDRTVTAIAMQSQRRSTTLNQGPSNTRYGKSTLVQDLEWNLRNAVRVLTGHFERLLFPHSLSSDILNGRIAESEGKHPPHARMKKKPLNPRPSFAIMNEVASRVASKARDLLYFEQWALLIDNGPRSIADVLQLRLALPPKDRFWADPFFVEYKGKTYVFLEEYIYAKKRGHISAFEYSKENHADISPIKVLEEPYHLSYPYVFTQGDDLFMVPESGENRTVDLYRADGSVHQWKKVSTLVKGVAAYDATIVEHEGRWWLFASIAERPGVSSCDELFVFVADQFDSSNWTPISRNPVVDDIRFARPGGRFIKSEGELYRVAQNSLQRYGHGMSLMKVESLTETSYTEAVSHQVIPPKRGRILATHTFNSSAKLTVGDAKLLRSRFW